MTPLTKRILICIIVVVLLLTSGFLFAFSDVFTKRKQPLLNLRAQSRSRTEN